MVAFSVGGKAGFAAAVVVVRRMVCVWTDRGRLEARLGPGGQALLLLEPTGKVSIVYTWPERWGLKVCVSASLGINCQSVRRDQ